MEVTYAVEDQGSKKDVVKDYIDSRAVLYGINTGLVGMVADAQPNEYQGVTRVNGEFVVQGIVKVIDDVGKVSVRMGKLSED